MNKRKTNKVMLVLNLIVLFLLLGALPFLLRMEISP